MELFNLIEKAVQDNRLQSNEQNQAYSNDGSCHQDDPLHQEKGIEKQPCVTFTLDLFDSQVTTEHKLEPIVEEVPVALVYNGIAHVVMMLLPNALEYFALGFSFSEGIIEKRQEIKGIEIKETPQGLIIEIELCTRQWMKLKEQRRNLAGRTGCGLCGIEKLEQLTLKPSKLPDIQQISFNALLRGLTNLRAHQPLGALTGATHIAAWLNNEGDITQIFEDVGRHNALDKLLGYNKSEQITEGALLISSRVSYEIVQKAAICGVEIIVAISAVTSLAIKTAKLANLTLIGFARDNRLTVYNRAERVLI